jgi:hypothetical protein
MKKKVKKYPPAGFKITAVSQFWNSRDYDGILFSLGVRNPLKRTFLDAPSKSCPNKFLILFRTALPDCETTTAKIPPAGGTGLFRGDSFYRTNRGTSSAVLAFGRVNPAGVFLFGNRVHRTFTVTGTAINTRVSNLVSHIIPLYIYGTIKILYELIFCNSTS